MVTKSAGLLMYRDRNGIIEVLLAHPGGPFWAKKDAGVWTIPKGLFNPGEDALAAARREFLEETGFPPTGTFVPLGSITQKSGKEVFAWAFPGDCNPADARSNTCDIEWPPNSGKTITIPEVDRVEFFNLAEAEQRILPAQIPFLARLAEHLGR